MLDINAELEKILINNNIICKINLDKEIAFIRNFQKCLTDKDVVGIYGVGVDANTLLFFLTGVVKELRIDYCFDRSAKKYTFKNVIKNPTVLNIREIHKVPVNYMIIGSYLHRHELKEALREEGYGGIIIDFFELIDPYLQEYTTNYKKIYEVKKKFENSLEDERKGLLKKLIKEYLLIKDFINAFNYINLYIKSGYGDSEVYKNLLDELQQLFVKIKRRVNSRRYNDIVINWLDALPYLHLPEFPFLQMEAGNGINFENAYTVNPWTTETMKTLLFGEYSIKDKAFQKDEFVTNETKLLRLLDMNGYTFAYLGMNKYAKMYDDKTITLPEFNFYKDSSSISRQWDALNLLCKEERPLALMIHTVYETHEPYICGEIEPFQKFTCTEDDWEQEDCKKQAKISGQYVDNLLSFYSEYYGKNSIKIYMSDHGRITNSIMRESRVHTIFIVNCPGVKGETIKGLFSLIDFNQVIECCLKKNFKFQELVRDYIFVEALDYYNPELIKLVLNDPKYNKLEALQRRGIITLEDRYCRFANGKECYFVSPDDKQNRINEKKYATRIKELRNLCGDEFIDINQYDKFECSKLLYETQGIDIKGK